MLSSIFKIFATKFAKKVGLSSLFCALALSVPLAGTPSLVAAELSQADRAALASATQTHFAYIKTGNTTLDQMSEYGLFGLGRIMHKRTTVEDLLIQRGAEGIESNLLATSQAMPVGVDPAIDELAFYSEIYWPIDPRQEQLSEKAIAGLNKYMRSGGLLFIDTRDLSTNNRGRAWLRRMQEKGLNIPALEKVEGCSKAAEECHVLGKTFYLLGEFPGRYAGGDLWAERTDEFRNDGVASVIIGGNEYAAAWALDENDQPLYPVIGDNPKQREQAYRVGVNLIMYARAGSYKNDQVHIPAILQRMKNKP